MNYHQGWAIALMIWLIIIIILLSIGINYLRGQELPGITVDVTQLNSVDKYVIWSIILSCVGVLGGFFYLYIVS